MTVIEQRAYEAIISMAKKNEPDYWEKLKHQYAGMAMQGILSNEDYCKVLLDEITEWSFAESVARASKDFATALIEKLKNE